MGQENELRLHSCNLGNGFEEDVKNCPRLAELDNFTRKQHQETLRILVSKYLNARVAGAEITWKYGYCLFDTYVSYTSVLMLQTLAAIFIADTKLTLQVRKIGRREARFVPMPTLECLHQLNSELGALTSQSGADLNGVAIRVTRHALENFLRICSFDDRQ